MSKDYYKISEVVFGLRDEYQRVGNKLQELNKYSRLEDENKDLRFNVINGDLGYLYSANYEDYYCINLYSLLNKEKGFYQSDLNLKITDRYSFTELADNILEDDFVKNLNFFTSFEENNKIVKIKVDGGFIHVCLDNISKMKSSLNMLYCSKGLKFPNDDIIWIYKKRSIVTLEEMYDLFDISVPKDELPSYYKEVIDNYYNIELSMGKRFISSASFEITEDEDKHILKKVKTPCSVVIQNL